MNLNLLFNLTLESLTSAVFFTPTALPIIRNFSTFSSIKTVWMALRYVLYVQDIFSRQYISGKAVSAFGRRDYCFLFVLCASTLFIWRKKKALDAEEGRVVKAVEKAFPLCFKAQIMIFIFPNYLMTRQVLWSPKAFEYQSWCGNWWKESLEFQFMICSN